MCETYLEYNKTCKILPTIVYLVVVVVLKMFGC